MIKFLLFLYLVSVVIFFLIITAQNTGLVMLYKKYDITMPKQSLFRNISGRLFWLLVSLVPGLRLIFVLLIAYGYSEKEKEFKLQSGDMR